MHNITQNYWNKKELKIKLLKDLLEIYSIGLSSKLAACMSISNKSLKNVTNSAGTHGSKDERIIIPFINNVKSLSF